MTTFPFLFPLSAYRWASAVCSNGKHRSTTAPGLPNLEFLTLARGRGYSYFMRGKVDSEAGENVLEIRVANLAENRMIGDEFL
jgi:hypothetical protein